MRGASRGLAVCLALSVGAAWGASTWNIVYPVGVSNVTCVSFADARVGVVGGSGGKGMFGTGQDVGPIAYTADGGQTWGNAWVERPSIKGVTSLQMLSAKLGVGLGGDEQGTWLLRSADGGKTWTARALPPELKATRVWFSGEREGWAWGVRQPAMGRTADGGATWQTVDLKPFAPVAGWVPWAWAPVSAREFYLVGNFDWVLHTRDGGASFEKTAVTWEGPRDYLNLSAAAAAPDGKTLYLVGGIASDYTENWRPPKEGVILRSPDGGASWERQKAGVVNSLLGVAAVSATEAWAGGFGGYGLTPWLPGVLLHTTDAGKTWKNESPSQVSVRGVFALNRDTVWAVGGQGGSPYETAGVVLCYAPEAEGERPQGHIALKYTMPAEGYASLVVKDAGGRQVRTLLAHARRAAGKQTDWWDGLDDDGLPVAAGKYAWKLLTHQGIRAEYRASYNCPNQPSWTTADGKGGWAGDHGAPTSVCAVGETMVLGFGAGEAQPAQIVVDLEGRKNGICGKGWSLALATDGKYVYAADEQFTDYNKRNDPQVQVVSSLTRWEAATGRFGYFGQTREATREVHRWTLDQTKPEPFLAQRLEQGLLGPEFSGHTVNNIHVRTTNLCGLACGGGKVFASLRLDNQVLILDAEGKPLGELTVPAPAGLAWHQGTMTLYVVSGTSVRRYQLNQDGRSFGGEGVEVVKGLEAPFALAVDAQGNLAVGDWGKSMQVKLFSPQGELLRTWGKAGGRPWLGQYDAAGMIKPRGLAFDARGRLWVAEDDEPLKRVAVWNADGTLAKDLIGAGRYACFSWQYPDEPGRAYANVYGVTSFRVDREKNTWAPEAVLYRDGWDPKRIGPMLPFFRTKAPNGEEIYLSDTRCDVLGMAVKREGLLQPLLAVGWAPMIVPPDVANGWNQPFNPVMRKMRTDYKRHGSFYDEHGGEVCLWVDRSRDGLYQEAELSYVTLPGWDTSGAAHNPPGSQSWGQWIGPDLTLYLTAQWLPGQVWRWPLASWGEQGPVYRPEDLKLVVTMPTRATGAITVGPEGTLVCLGSLEAFDAQGQWKWRYPQHWPGQAFQAPFGKPGLVVGTQAFCGWVDDMVMVSGYMGQFNVLTGDGLYVAQFLKDGRVGGALAAEVVAAENFSGLWLREAQSKRVYLVVGGGADSRIFEILGLETIKRAAGELTLTAADAAKARQAAAARPAGAATAERSAVIRKVAEAPALGGDLDAAWKSLAPVAEVQEGGRTGFTVRAAHDGQALYLAWEVGDGSPMVNGGDDFRMLFKTGDAVDLMLGPAAEHKTVLPGDLRLLLSAPQGKPTAVLYRPLILPGQTPAPAKFASPSRAVAMERVTEETGVQVTVQRRDGGYVLKAKVPFEVLGLQYTAGLQARGDFGVVYSDQEGSRNAFRSYWATRDPAVAIVNDVPSEAALYPATWGRLTFE